VSRSVERGRWHAETERLLDRMAGRFARVETRCRDRGFLLGLLADLPRKNCWSIAEHAGDADPHGMQHLLNRASWDTYGVRDDLRDYVTTHLGDSDAVLVVDETGDLKKGAMTVGVTVPGSPWRRVGDRSRCRCDTLGALARRASRKIERDAFRDTKLGRPATLRTILRHGLSLL